MKKIDEFVDDYYPEEGLLKMDGHDDACLGVVEVAGQSPRLVYDRSKVVQTLVDRDGMSGEEAQEFFDFNIGGAYVGEGTPAFISLIPEEYDS